MSINKTASLGEPAVRDFISSARIAHLATCDSGGAPHNVPICFWFDGECFYFVIDEKPKRKGAKALKRMRNIAENPRVAILVDHYEEDWAHLAYVLVHGRADVVEDAEEYLLALRGLRDKYPQYRAMALSADQNAVVRIEPDRVHLWGARFGAWPA
jgi:PPOX class probable F420-dependent enzyme